MSYIPDPETMLVLKQIGYSDVAVTGALASFKAVSNNFPDLVKPTSKNFVLFLRASNVHECARAEKDLNHFGIWSPGNAEVLALEQEGYWKEIISFALIEFLCKPYRKGVPISKFAIFRSYLRKKEPLVQSNIDGWKPSMYLTRFIKEELDVPEHIYWKFMQHFKKLIKDKDIESRFISRSFFYFIKKNKIRILHS